MAGRLHAPPTRHGDVWLAELKTCLPPEGNFSKILFFVKLYIVLLSFEIGINTSCINGACFYKTTFVPINLINILLIEM